MRLTRKQRQTQLAQLEGIDVYVSKGAMRDALKDALNTIERVEVALEGESLTLATAVREALDT